MRLFCLLLLFLFLSASDTAAKRGRSGLRLENNSARVKRKRPTRSAKVRKLKPKQTKPKVRHKPSPKLKYHKLRYLWLNEVLGNTKRRTIRKKLKIRKKRQP